MGHNSSCEYIGPKGDKGYKGDMGAIGDAGDKGIIGDVGDVGDKGEAGFKGYKGDAGDIGDKGIQGDRGSPGETGFKGDRGDKGPKGETGDKGIRGDKGDKGERGDSGLKGDRGLKGDTGAVGGIGLAGDTGLQGEKGFQGDKGDIGDVGPNGDDGPQGEKGDIGPQGEKGIKGDIGIGGDRGPQGEEGLPGVQAYQRISSGEIIIRKIIEYARQTKRECFINTTYSTTSNINGIGKINNKSVVSEFKYDCVVFDEVDVKVDKIASISFVSNSQNDRDSIVMFIKNMIANTNNCENSTADVRNLTNEGIPLSGIDISTDFDFFVQCNCINDRSPNAVLDGDLSARIIGNCRYQAKGIKLCKKEEDETSILRKRIEREMNSGRSIRSMLIYSGDFTDLSTIDTNIKIELLWFGAGVFSYATSDNRFILTITNLDKVCYVDFV